MTDSKRVQRQIDQLIAHRAAEWLDVLKTGDAGQRREFDQWLRQSPMHVDFFLDVMAIDRELQALPRLRAGELKALVDVIAQDAPPLSPPYATGAGGTPLERRRLWHIGFAAAAALTLGVALFWGKGEKVAERSVLPPRLTTAVGEQRSLTLEDGSLVTLNALSDIRVDFSARKRDVRLESGEAIFKVARDARRPFEVRTRLATVRAVGTQFNVYQRTKDTLVSVVEGRVQVMPISGGGVQQLAAGEEVQVGEDGRIVKRAHPDVAKTLAWRQRRLSFEGTPLEDMVREFNRYNGAMKLRVEGDELGRRRYGGIFDAADPESLAQVLEREKDLVVERREGEIVIRDARIH